MILQNYHANRYREANTIKQFSFETFCTVLVRNLFEIQGVSHMCDVDTTSRCGRRHITKELPLRRHCLAGAEERACFCGLNGY